MRIVINLFLVLVLLINIWGSFSDSFLAPINFICAGIDVILLFFFNSGRTK